MRYRFVFCAGFAKVGGKLHEKVNGRRADSATTGESYFPPAQDGSAARH